MWMKLKRLLIEINHKQLPDKSLGHFLLNHKVHPFSGTLYHGSPMEGLKEMLSAEIYGQEHNEIAEYESFSTSINPDVLRLFSEGHGNTGLEFNVKNVKLLVIDDMLHHLLIALPGSGMEIEVGEEEMENFARQYNIPYSDHYGYYLPYNYVSSLGVDGFVFEYTWKKISSGHWGGDRDENEIGFVGNGISTLQKSIDAIHVEGESFSINEKSEALIAIQEHLENQ